MKRELAGQHVWRTPFESSRCREPVRGGDRMSTVARIVDLAQVQPVPWAWVDEHVYAAIRGCSQKVLQNERRLNIGCPFRRIIINAMIQTACQPRYLRPFMRARRAPKAGG